MQPIIIIGAAVVGFALLGTGFLGKPWNDIDLWVQELGWGERNLEAPISHAYIDLELKKVPNENNTPNDKSDDYFNNLIKACSFHSDQSLDPFDTTLGLAPALIICKLTNEEGLAIAEGRIVLDGVGIGDGSESECEQRDAAQNGYTGSTTIRIDICQMAYPFSNEVQEVHDIKIVVENALNRMVPTVPTTHACGTSNINDYCVDGDGIASAGRGAFTVTVGDVLSPFGYGFPPGNEGIDVFGTDSSQWLIGWTDIHLEDPNGACQTGIRNGFHETADDCVVLDLDSSLQNGQGVDCDLESGAIFTGCPPFAGPNSIKFVDEPDPITGIPDGIWNNGEDIILDINGNGIFD